MNLRDSKYKNFALVREMLETPANRGKFRLLRRPRRRRMVRRTGKLFLTGEGSSRIFPAKNMICSCWRRAYRWRFAAKAPAGP